MSSPHVFVARNFLILMGLSEVPDSSSKSIIDASRSEFKCEILAKNVKFCAHRATIIYKLQSSKEAREKAK